MIKIDLQLLGGRGASSGSVKASNKSRFSSALEAFRENARQFNQAKIDAKQSGASILEYTDISGKTMRFYWNGSVYVDRSSALHEDKYKKGLFRAKFK